ncbi:hypothetical protein DVH24_002990 [Malus domestica]|uniref:non-specific serine/threonine protein kinase n=1 Tax=Malus domestica TaxID=3750 RepID=A0A498KBR7_MALDO|nr:hypothetical protein DVH24_002990 [Malus domestica]
MQATLELPTGNSSRNTVNNAKHMRKFVKQIMMNIFLPRLLLLHSLLVVCFATFAFGATRLPQDEVQALADIAKTLGKTGWDFSVDPCSGQLPWTNISKVEGFKSAVTCNCSFDDSTVCHVTSIILKTQDLPGTLPREMVRLKYLQEIDLTRNYLNGTIPPEWSSLQLVNISLIGNRLTGPIPVEFGNIITLKSLDLSSNSLSGVLPEELGNFPNLERMMLRSCNIIGELPSYLGQMTKLKALDLSYNKLTGEIPSSYASLAKVEYIFLTGNLLTGPLPAWPKVNVDLSFNNFTIGNTSCLLNGGLNLFDSSSKGNSSGVSCSTAAKCPKTWYSSFHINCGGKEVTIENTTYEDDTFSVGPSSFYQSRTNWALSSTGYFPDDNRATDNFIWTNETRLYMANPQLYMNARLSPISLTYFGFCLQNRKYTVSLHFAELMFRSGNTYKSLGRRDIQVLPDFNIMDYASVFGNVVSFTADVTNHTLKIRLYWAGKGTTGIPVRGVYGPLISAISVEPAVDNSSTKTGSSISPGVNGVSVGAVVGIVAGGIFIILVILCILWRRGSLGQQKTLEDEARTISYASGHDLYPISPDSNY